MNLEDQWDTTSNLSPALREDVRDHQIDDRVLSHFDQVIDGNVVLSVDNHKEKRTKRQKVEIQLLHLKQKGRIFYLRVVTLDMYAAIDLMVDKLGSALVISAQGQDSRDMPREAMKYPTPEGGRMERAPSP